MSSKRIAFFGIKYFPSQGGSSRVAESIAKELQGKHDITIYCYKNLKAKDHLDNVSVVQIPRIPLKEVGVFLYYFLCCLHILFSKKYDLIHVHKTDSAIFIPLLRLKTKVIATSQEAPYLRDKWNALTKAYFRFMEYVFIHTSSMRTSVSKPLAIIYEERYAKKVHYIPNGVNTSLSNKEASIKSILSDHGIKEFDEYILFAARRIMATKGCHTLMNALHKTNYRGKILIAGQESHAKGYMKSIYKMAEGLDVSFLGYVADKDILMALIDRAKIFMFPSLTEGLSLMLLEVGCRGTTPILCSDIPENTAVFTNEEVLFFEANNSKDLAEKFAWATSNFLEMQEKTQKAKNVVHEKYSSEVVAHKYDKLYGQLLYSR